MADIAGLVFGKQSQGFATTSPVVIDEIGENVKQRFIKFLQK